MKNITQHYIKRSEEILLSLADIHSVDERAIRVQEAQAYATLAVAAGLIEK